MEAKGAAIGRTCDIYATLSLRQYAACPPGVVLRRSTSPMGLLGPWGFVEGGLDLVTVSQAV